MINCLALPVAKGYFESTEGDPFPLQLDLNLMLQVKHLWMEDFAETIAFQCVKSSTEV